MPPVSPCRRGRPAELNFEDLVRPEVEYLYRLAWRFTGSVADAEDLVQDVLLKLYPRTQEMPAHRRGSRGSSSRSRNRIVKEAKME
jgi:DNA-directed RNA polymerase specialized sigma24 family protein